MKNRIVCAANKSSVDGLLILGARHFDNCMRATIAALGRKHTEFNEQGFIDRFGNFLTRSEAFDVAEEANQIIRECGTEHTKELYSENIY